MWLVEGLDDGRFALISKTHHALVDGVSGVDLATVMFDLDARCRRQPSTRSEPWHPRADAVARSSWPRAACAGWSRAVRRGRARARRRDAIPPTALHVAREAAEGIGEVVWAGLNPAPATPLNVPIGPHRRLVWSCAAS